MICRTRIDEESFAVALTKIGPIELLGVATYLGVSNFEDDEMKVPKDAAAIVCDILDQYGKLSTAKKKEIMRLLKKAGRK